MSLADARKEARDILHKARSGDPHAEKAVAKARAALTFGALVPRYIAAAEARLKPTTIRDLKHSLNVQFADLHTLPVNAIKRADVAARIAAIVPRQPKEKGKRTHGGAQAASRARVVLSGFFSWAMGEGLVEANPVIGTNKPAPIVSRDRVLSDAELVKVWYAAGSANDFGRIVRLLILTGQRRDEVANLGWCEVDLKNGLWRLPKERTKNGRPHDVPLSPAAVAVLSGIVAIEGRDLVFGKRGRGGFSGFTKAKADMDKAANLSAPWRLHDLRRTAATGMAELGVLPHVIEAVLNHVSGSRAGVAGIYNRASYAAEKKDALERWAEHLLFIIE